MIIKSVATPTRMPDFGSIITVPSEDGCTPDTPREFKPSNDKKIEQGEEINPSSSDNFEGRFSTLEKMITSDFAPSLRQLTRGIQLSLHFFV